MRHGEPFAPRRHRPHRRARRGRRIRRRRVPHRQPGDAGRGADRRGRGDRRADASSTDESPRTSRASPRASPRSRATRRAAAECVRPAAPGLTATITFQALLLDAADNPDGADRVFTWASATGSVKAEVTSVTPMGDLEMCLSTPDQGRSAAARRAAGPSSAKTTKSPRDVHPHAARRGHRAARGRRDAHVPGPQAQGLDRERPLRRDGVPGDERHPGARHAARERRRGRQSPSGAATRSRTRSTSSSRAAAAASPTRRPGQHRHRRRLRGDGAQPVEARAAEHGDRVRDHADERVDRLAVAGRDHRRGPPGPPDHGPDDRPPGEAGGALPPSSRSPSLRSSPGVPTTAQRRPDAHRRSHPSPHLADSHASSPPRCSPSRPADGVPGCRARAAARRWSRRARCPATRPASSPRPTSGR